MPAIKSYLSQNVYEAALDRIRYLFDEFPNVIVNISGGKDSTVLRELALIVAEEKGRLPLKCYHADLEVEWETVVEYLRGVMADPRIEPLWMQVSLPKAIINASSVNMPYFHCWDPKAEAIWMREKEPFAIKENVYGTDSYYGLFSAFDKYHFGNEPVCRLGGIRTEESPARMMGMTSYATYKDITWGSKEAASKGCPHYTFYPLYDWSYTDIWKSIHDNNWKYCSIYDLQYQYGVNLREMRISSVIHESSVRTLFHMQEFEPETWNKIAIRVPGANSTAHLKKDFFCPTELPPMFKNWSEYRDHLLENLITDDTMRENFHKQFAARENMFTEEAMPDLIKTEINIILTLETEAIKLNMFTASHGRMLKGQGKFEDRDD